MFQIKDYILQIWKTGSFSQAAANLYVSQPSLSASVRRLEAKIGQPLFDRSTHPVRLTQCGQAYVEAAQAIATAEENFATFMEQYENCQIGTLLIGGSNLNLSFVLPPLIKEFQQTYPGIRLEVKEGNIDDLKQLLLEGELDLVVDSCKLDPERYSGFSYRQESLILSVPAQFACNKELAAYQMTREDILRNKHLQPQQPALSLQKMKDVPFVLPTPETDTYQRCWQLFKRAGFEPKEVLSLHQQATVFHMNCAGMGAAIISDILIKNTYANPDMVYYKLGGSDTLRYIQFFKKKEKQMTAAMKKFLETAQSPLLKGEEKA